MKFIDASLKAGEPYPFAANGDYFRIMSGEADYRIKFQFTDGSEFETRWKVGIGAPLKKTFTHITLISDVDQETEIAYAKGAIDDNRLVGEVSIAGTVSIDGVLPVQSIGSDSVGISVVTVGTSSALHVGPDTDRMRMLIQNLSPNNVYYSFATVSVVSGFKIAPSETLTLKNKASVFLIADGPDSDVRIFQEAN